MAVKRSDRFKPIHNLAQQSEDIAAQSLGKFQRELSAHHSKLSELVQYYDDYKSQFNEKANNGMSIIQVKSYQKFISQLELAIEEQKKNIVRITEACDSSRADWMVERQKTQALEKVMTRYQKQEQTILNRQEQRRSDELVANRLWHKDKKT